MYVKFTPEANCDTATAHVFIVAMKEGTVRGIWESSEQEEKTVD